MFVDFFKSFTYHDFPEVRNHILSHSNPNIYSMSDPQKGNERMIKLTSGMQFLEEFHFQKTSK